VLCQLSYIGVRETCARRLERETGIEPATNSLEGCDSTTELLPPTHLALLAPRLTPTIPLDLLADRARLRIRPACPAEAGLNVRHGESWWGGEGSNLRSPKAAGLQPAAIDRSATSPFPRSQPSVRKAAGFAAPERGWLKLKAVLCCLIPQTDDCTP
jgi:hypothetical protein